MKRTVREHAPFRGNEPALKETVMKRLLSVFFVAFGLFALTVLRDTPAEAVPSFARQTGLSCNGCHTTPPELNAAGRRFKLTGYTDRADDTATVSSEPGKHHAGLDLLKSLPLSAMFDTSFTAIKTPEPDSNSTSFQFPQDISLFLSGGWSSHIGSFIQITYSTQDDHFGLDNSDVRFADKTTLGGKELVWGLTLNNNPTVEDLWNTTPAWGFPWVASDWAPTPAAAPLLAGALAQDVAGLGAYAMWNEHLYLAAAIYATNHVGSSQPNTGADYATNISGVAPYWRAAWQQSLDADDDLEIGTYGIRVNATPDTISGLRNNSPDWGFDLQYDRTVFVRDVVSVRVSYVRETSTLNATYDQGGATQAANNLGMFSANVGYHFGNVFSVTAGVQDIIGTGDAILWAPAAVTGSANGSPNSLAYLGNLSWWPIQNLQLAAQYTAYTNFNGGTTNYDGSGRNASDNNTIYLLARLIF
jgi:hypothetical protein